MNSSSTHYDMFISLYGFEIYNKIIVYHNNVQATPELLFKPTKVT